MLRIRDAYRGYERQPKFEVYKSSVCVTLLVANEEMPLLDDERRVYRELVGRSLQMSCHS